MFTFKDFLLKENASPTYLLEAKNVHLEHLEDEILNKGIQGAESALAFLEGVAGMLRGHSNKKYNVTVKWDGAPAIFCGTDPQTGKFFVGTKAVLSKKTPKIIYSPADAQKYYGDQPGLADALTAAITHLPKLGIKGILQGDMMFGPGDVEEKTIAGGKMVTFKPNTILYAVPTNSELAAKIKRAKMGIIFHTRYSGNSLNDLSSSFGVDVSSLNKTSDVWYDDATYKDASGTVTFTAQEEQAIEQAILSARSLLGKIDKSAFNSLLSNKTLIGMFKMYINQRIREGKHFDLGFADGLKKFIESRIEKEKTKPETKQAKKEKYIQMINEHKNVIDSLIAFQKQVNDAKIMVIKKLNAVNSIGTFLPVGNNYQVTAPEGFVAIDHVGNAVKLVDRLEFSRANFAKDR